MSFERQVLVIYAATKGYVDEVATDKLLSYEAGLVDFFEARYNQVLVDMNASGKLTDDVVDALNKASRNLRKACRLSVYDGLKGGVRHA